MERKHAYLILAHNQFDLLKILLSMIDDKRNDIYLHIDKKAGAISKNEFATHNANLYLLKERFNIGWGAFSLIKATLRLFETATWTSYLYPHKKLSQTL